MEEKPTSTFYQTGSNIVQSAEHFFEPYFAMVFLIPRSSLTTLRVG